MRDLLQIWPAIVFGWPAILIALALAVTGIVREKRVWLIAATILVLPISFYLFGSPRFWWLGLSIPLLLSGASFAVSRRRNKIAWALLVPVLGIFGWLAVLVAGE